MIIRKMRGEEKSNDIKIKIDNNLSKKEIVF